MADVFISYSRLDHERVQPIADRLASLGYSVWWDKHTRSGQDFVDELKQQLDSARCVLVVWSHNARSATWVQTEAAYAHDAGKLLQLAIDAVQPPAPFHAYDIADMSGGRSSWGPLEDALAKLVRDGVAAAPVRRASAPGLFAAATAVGAPRLALLALVAVLTAFAGTMTAAVNGLMTPDQVQLAMTGMFGVAGACAALAAHRYSSIARAGG
ncbi:MAG: toll/interleukin-1 receptor domain-containing protein [Hyphomonadaceae bacterium]